MQTSAILNTLLLASREISRFPRKERPHMPGSATTPGRLGTCDVAPIRLAFRQQNDVGTRDSPIEGKPSSNTIEAIGITMKK